MPIEVTLTRLDWLLAAPLLWLAGSAVVLLLADAIRPSRITNAAICLIGLAGAVVGFLPLFQEAAGGVESGFSGMLRADLTGLVLAVLCVACSFASALLALRNLEGYEEGRHSTALWTLMLLAPLGMILTLWAGHLVILFLGIETLSIPLYVLTALRRKDEASIEAGLKYFLLGAFGSGFLAFGIASLFAGTGTMGIDAVALAPVGGPQAVIGLGMVLIALLFKAAAAPFHLWVADVYQGAPTAITTLMATGTKAAAFGALLRWAPGPEVVPPAGWALIGLLTLAAANFTALNQSNLKRMLALSGVAHVGILLLAFAAQAALGDTTQVAETVTFYLVAYAAAAVAGFGALELLERRTGGSSEDSLLRGLGRRHPLIGAALCVAILSLAGVPMTAGFLAKYFVFVELIRAGMVVWALLGILLTLVAFGYYLRALVNLFMVEPAPQEEREPVRADYLATAAVLVPAVLSVLLGIWPGPLRAAS